MVNLTVTFNCNLCQCTVLIFKVLYCVYPRVTVLYKKPARLLRLWLAMTFTPASLRVPQVRGNPFPRHCEERQRRSNLSFRSSGIASLRQVVAELVEALRTSTSLAMTLTHSVIASTAGAWQSLYPSMRGAPATKQSLLS